MGLVAPGWATNRSGLAALTGAQPTSGGRRFAPDRPPAMEFHLLNVEASTGNPIAWLSLFLRCVGASRARGSWSAQTGGKATWVWSRAAWQRGPAAKGLGPPIQAELPLSQSFNTFQESDSPCCPLPPASSPSRLARGLPGSGPGEEPHSPNFVPEAPGPATAELLGLGLGIKGLQDFPLEMSPPQEAGR